MTSSRFAYAQARLQARHAERVLPQLWVRLETSQSVEHFLQAARGTALSRWIRLLDREPDARAVEAALELEFRAHVDEVADWVEEPWARSVRWTRWLPLLERLEARPVDERAARLVTEGDALPLLDGDAGGYWYRHFRSLWPRAGAKTLEEVVELVARHLSAMKEARSEDSGPALRAELARELERLFRRQPATPVAVFCHLGLTLLELERLRGAILLRLLLPRARSALAWA
jgi:hypothetical protein